MRDTSLSFDSVDPLAGYEGIALFPQTFGCDLPPVDTDDLLHNHLKSMALRSPNKLLQQAKTILDDSSKLLNSEVPSDIPIQGNKEVDTNDNEIHRERRPGIGRKRARFSLKPNSSQPTVSLEPNLDISQLKDPEEFFMAYERHEKATREIQKQTGSTFVDFDKQNPSTKPRQRRPGILGPNKRTVKYKHFHSSVLSDGNEPPISSKENFEQDILSPTQNMHQGTSDFNTASQSQELDGSISVTEKRTDGLLDELLSTSCEDLDGDEGLVLLQEHLQIKPMVFEKLSLPDLRNIRRNDPKAFNGKSPKPRQVLVDIQNILGGPSCKLPAKYKEETVVQNMGSPTPPRNPFASLLGLKKNVLHQSEPLGDPYSFSVDTSPARNVSHVDFAVEQSDLNDTTKDLCSSGVSKSLRIVEDDSIVAEPCPPKVTTGDSCGQNGKSKDEIRLCRSSELKSSRTEEDDSTVAKPSTPIINIGDSPDQNGKSGEDDSRNVCSDHNFGSRKPYVDLEGNTGGSGIDERTVNENLSMSDADLGFRTEEVSAFHDNCEEMQVEDVPEAGVHAVEEPNSTADHLDKSSVAASKDQTIGGPPESVDNGVEQQQHLEMSQEPSDTSKNEQRKSKLHPGKRHKRKHTPQMQNPDGENMSHEQEYLEASRDSVDEQTKAKLSPHKERKRKDSSKRQSLAGAGTKWDGGVRRSTRFRTRPLEYWKGERLLYGRIHNSMSTVIGMKYFSPAKGDRNPTVKVKQIVTDEYKELVDRAAWH